MITPEQLEGAKEQYVSVFGEKPPTGEISLELQMIAKRLKLPPDNPNRGMYLVYPINEDNTKQGDGMWLSKLRNLIREYSQYDHDAGLPDWTKWKKLAVIRVWFDESKTLQSEGTTLGMSELLMLVD